MVTETADQQLVRVEFSPQTLPATSRLLGGHTIQGMVSRDRNAPEVVASSGRCSTAT